ncbi:hypothetical protein [Puerhibacterium puerhi]|uniref:hypothetical protein n=1 Tax=Puerhibacterium puerhi TaxID=2692623 RepID=UPI0013574CDF|nr:hypothetical protein [Puerhibacterium puerhi]
MVPDRARPDRLARRALYRAHHPDRGGDPAELVRRLGELDARQRASAEPAAPADVVFVHRRRLARLRAWAARRRRPPRVV